MRRINFPHQGASNPEIWCFLSCKAKQTVEHTVQLPVIWDAMMLNWHYFNDVHNGFSVASLMSISFSGDLQQNTTLYFLLFVIPVMITSYLLSTFAIATAIVCIMYWSLFVETGNLKLKWQWLYHILIGINSSRVVISILPSWASYGMSFVGILRRLHIDGLVQERRNSNVLSMELCLSCTNPLICK